MIRFLMMKGHKQKGVVWFSSSLALVVMLSALHEYGVVGV